MRWPAEPGAVVRQGEDLGRWGAVGPAQLGSAGLGSAGLGWDKLTIVQQWMCEHIISIQAADRGRETEAAPHTGRQVGA
ncbi:hypothetical protein [Streptomyces sp. NPDC007905]|uniref:hypothetical protein n=1 Tax=Streptomyces sp. NPDC007905 TaxID=3364788 RepID=UPI0036E1CE78